MSELGTGEITGIIAVVSIMTGAFVKIVEAGYNRLTKKNNKSSDCGEMRDDCKVRFEFIGRDIGEIKEDIKFIREKVDK